MCKKRFYAIPPLVIPLFACHRRTLLRILLRTFPKAVSRSLLRTLLRSRVVARPPWRAPYFWGLTICSGCRRRGVEFKGGSRQHRNRHNHRNRQNHFGHLFALYFVGWAQGQNNHLQKCGSRTVLRLGFPKGGFVKVSGSTPTPWSGPIPRLWSETMVSVPLGAQKTLEIKGFLGLERPFLDLVSQTPRPRGRRRPLFADFVRRWNINNWGRARTFCNKN